MVRNKLSNEIQVALSAKLPHDKVQEVVEFFVGVTSNHRLSRYELCLVHGGKFVEAVLKCLYYKRTGQIVDEINVDEEIVQLKSGVTLDQSEQFVIPAVLYTIYNHCNRRGGIHNNSFNPNEIDATLILANVKWVMEELIRLYYTSDPQAAQALVANLLVKDLQLVENIDEDYLVLKADLSARIQLEILLLKHYPQRSMDIDLIRWLKHVHSEQNIRVTLANMRKKVLVHENDQGWLLTGLGIKEVEDEISKILQSINEKKVRPARRRVKYARR